MKNLPNDQLNNNYDNEINLRELFYALWDKIFYIGVITSIFSLISIIYALMLPNVFQSQASMMPLIDEGNGMNSILGRYSGMTSLAGISLPSESRTKGQEAIARIKSFEFFSNDFLPQIKLENLMAVKEWNQTNNTLIYEESTFNSESRQWVRKVSPPKSIVPSSQEAYEKYQIIMNIKEDKITSFVTLSVEHKSPVIAQQWVEIILDQIDQVMRDQDRQTAMRSIEYLNSLTPTVNYEEIKQALSALQQEQMKKLMMVEANANYIFKVLDSPIVPEKKSKPRRALIVILGSLLGMMLSSLGVLVFHYTRKSS